MVYAFGISPEGSNNSESRIPTHPSIPLHLCWVLKICIFLRRVPEGGLQQFDLDHFRHGSGHRGFPTNFGLSSDSCISLSILMLKAHFWIWAGHGPISDQNGHAGWLATTFRKMAPIWTMFDTAPATLDFQEIVGCRQTRAFHCRFRCKKCIFWSGLGMAPFWTKTLAC